MSYADYAKGPTQEKVATGLDEGKSAGQIAKELDIDEANCRRSVRALKDRAAKKGYSPEHGLPIGAPEGYYMSKATVTYNNKTGELERVWPRYIQDPDEVERAALAFLEDLPRIPDQKFTLSDYDTDVIPWYQIGDGHLGMLARKSETGHDFNLEIGVRELMVAMATLIDERKPTERCVIQDCGDMAHFENSKYETERGGNRLENACTLPELIRARRKIMRFMIERALTKSRYVDVIINQGNHSRSMDWALQDTLTALYEESKRVTILNNENIFIPYRMGNTFVVCTHTDKVKPIHAASVAADIYRDDWGEARYIYIDGGHVHHKQAEKEANGALYQSWNQIAPNDKHAHDLGYSSRQCLCVVERSKTYGEQTRHTLTRDRVRDIIDNLPAGTTAKERREVYTV